jgi:asparagine synthase (glutamine-hydrolysing)
MCGIAAAVGPGASEDRVRAMTDRLAHRGPDAAGVVGSGAAWLGHRRLAVIDCSSAGRQPMQLGPYLLTYNGEIYNYRELRRELPGPFRSGTDTEVLLHLYARYGPACLERLEGMFAFAIWDAERDELFAARDRVGIKPLYWTETSGTLRIASELKAFDDLSRCRIDLAALSDYLTYKYIPHPRTIYASIRQLTPAHTLTWRNGVSRVDRYWEPRIEPLRDADLVHDRLSELLGEVVPAHTQADVPIGVFLSGGLDSTTLVSCLDRPRTFTIGFDVADSDESGDAREVARHFDTEHTERRLDGYDVDEALDRLPGIYDEPFGDSAAWATYVLSREARRDVTVALSGEGGDEIFAGYRHHGRDLYRPGSPLWRLGRLLPPTAKLARSAYRRNVRGLERYASWTLPFTDPQKRTVLAPELARQNEDDLWFLRQHWREDLPPVKRMQWLELHTFLPADLLVKVDRASMAASLEVRPPFLDHRMVELGLSIAPELLWQGGRGKLPLRRVLSGRAPAGVLDRAKRGFGVPVGTWLARHPDKIRRTLARLARRGILRSETDLGYHSTQLWVLHVLDRWLDQMPGSL